MKIPAIKGIIKRRILLNYRVAPGVVQKILPSLFRPKLVDGYAIAGICLIRLEEIRPKGLPRISGIASENSAHRVAVVWNDGNETHEGVFVSRRDTDSKVNAVAGGRIFPGAHHLSRFSVKDEQGEITLKVVSGDHDVSLVDLKVAEVEEIPKSSVFRNVDESSCFFEKGCIGYSSKPNSCTLDGLLLKVPNWRVSALRVKHVQSAFFDDRKLFPEGSIELDHALLMRDIPHEWHSEAEMEAEPIELNESPPDSLPHQMP